MMPVFPILDTPTKTMTCWHFTR